MSESKAAHGESNVGAPISRHFQCYRRHIIMPTNPLVFSELCLVQLHSNVEVSKEWCGPYNIRVLCI
jgi:hypothetical protein